VTYLRIKGGRGRAYDAVAIRRIITSEVKRCAKARFEIAEGMAKLLGVPVTERMITSFTADSKELHRWPAEFDIAFCEVVGSYRLLAERVRRAGFQMIGPKDQELLKIGRAFSARAEAQAILDAKFAAVKL
jgi:hypothetical protein